MSIRRVWHGLSIKTDRYEVMVTINGFHRAWSVTRQPGFRRYCIGTARVYLVWPERAR